MANHNEQVFGELEDCYQAFIPKTKKKAPQKDSSDFQELYQMTVNEIDTLSQNIIDKKFQKLSISLLQWITDELTSTTYLVYDLKDLKQPSNISIKYGFLQDDTTNLITVSSFYDYLIDKRRKDERLHLDGLEFKLQNGFVVDHSLNFQIYNAEAGLPDLMSFVIDTCNNQYQTIVKAHTTVFLLLNYFTPDELSELRLYLINDLKLTHPDIISNLIFIQPLKLQTVITENYIGKIYSFIDPKKMFVDLLLQMICDPKIPLLSQELYSFWEQDFSYNIKSFEQQLFKVKQAYLLMYQSMIPTSEQLKDKKNLVLKDLLLSFKDEPAKNQQHIQYLYKRKILSDSIQVFSMYIEKLKSENQLHLYSFKVKLYGLLCSNQQSHWFTLSNDCKLEKAKELFRSYNFKLFLHENVQKYLDDKKYSLASEQQNKKNDRVMQMVQSNLSEKQRFEQYVNQFLNLFIIQILNDIRRNYSQYIFKDINQYFKFVQPDILEETHNHLIYHCSSNFKQTSENYKKIMNQYQVALSNLVEKQDILDFQTSIANLKILGLIEDTKRIKPTIERAAYAKQMYINYNDF